MKITVDKLCIRWYPIGVASERSHRDHKAVKKEMKKVLDNSRLDVIRYQSCCKRETKTTSKKLKKVLDRQKMTCYNSKAV